MTIEMVGSTMVLRGGRPERRSRPLLLTNRSRKDEDYANTKKAGQENTQEATPRKNLRIRSPIDDESRPIIGMGKRPRVDHLQLCVSERPHQRL
jgi:hypothetical protein